MSHREPKRTTQKHEKRSTARPTRPAEDTERAPDDHLGAVEADVADVTPPARGPAGKATKEDKIDPTDDLTPG